MRRVPCLILMLILSAGAVHAAGWQKYVAVDESFSFYYPEGFVDQSDESVVDLSNGDTREQLLMIPLTYVAADSAQRHGEAMLKVLREQIPDLEASNWKSEDSAATCEIGYTEEDARIRGQLILIKSEGNCVWFSYSAPAAGYSQARAIQLLVSIIGSLSDGTAAKEPEMSPLSPLEGKARAFLFVMEFALRFPFTVQQEDLVLDELLKGWDKASPDDLKKYDAYPGLVQTIMNLDQKQLSSTQQELSKTVREWLDTSPQNDPAVAMVREQLAEQGKLLAAGTPALTVMAARAYSELMGYAELLQEDPAANPDDVEPEVVAQIQKSLVAEWPKLSQEQREQVADTPGLWLVLRGALEEGTAADRAKVNAMLEKLAPKQAPPKPAGKPASGKPASSAAGAAPTSMAMHTSLMQIQQQTFNTWQWAMGFKSTMFGY
jgi:hypothetical protein